jgi:TRAP-type C4-dicarboxylate transport system substrate-binding protein
MTAIFATRRRAGASVLAAIALGLGATLAPNLAVAQQKVTLRVASFMAPQGFLAEQVVRKYLDRVVADSQGTLEYRLYPGGSLGRAQAEQLKLVQDGVADMAIVIPAYTPGAFENYDVSQLPGLADSTRTASMALWKVYEAGMLPTPDKVKVLGLVTTASNVLHTRKPTPAVKDLAGLKIRAAGGLQMQMVEAAGGAAVGNVRGPEIAEALSRNLLDGVLMDWIGIKEFRVDRLAANHIDYDFGRLATMLPINAATFEKLPEPAKAAFLKHGGLAYAEIGGKAFDDAVVEFRNEYVSTGQHKAGEFSSEDQARLKNAFAKVIEDWTKADPSRAQLVEAFRKAAAEAKQ